MSASEQEERELQLEEDQETKEILELENSTLRQIFTGFEDISVNILYTVMEVLYTQVQISSLDGRKHADLVENVTDSMFSILMRLTEDFPEALRRDIRKKLMNQEFLEMAHEAWSSMIEELDQKFSQES